MNRSQAIKAHCLECSGDSAKEVTLCVMFDCPLYPYRFGNSPGCRAYKRRMDNLKQRWPKDWEELQLATGENPPDAKVLKQENGIRSEETQ